MPNLQNDTILIDCHGYNNTHNLFCSWVQIANGTKEWFDLEAIEFTTFYFGFGDNNKKREKELQQQHINNHYGLRTNLWSTD